MRNGRVSTGEQNAVADQSEERDRDNRADWHAAKGDPARPIPENYQDGQSCPEECNGDRLLTLQ